MIGLRPYKTEQTRARVRTAGAINGRVAGNAKEPGAYPARFRSYPFIRDEGCGEDIGREILRSGSIANLREAEAIHAVGVKAVDLFEFECSAAGILHARLRFARAAARGAIMTSTTYETREPHSGFPSAALHSPADGWDDAGCEECGAVGPRVAP